MRKNSKIIAIVCALSMVISMFTGLTIVKADNEGIALEITQTDKTHATVTAKYTGVNGTSGFVVKLTKPEGATVTPTLPTPYATAIKNDAGATYDITWAGSSNTTSENNVLVTFDVVLADELASDFNFEVAEGSSLDDTDDATGATTTYEQGEDFTSQATMRKDPNATPAPTAMPKPSSNPDVPAPEVKEPVTVTKGIELTATKVSDTKFTVTAKYVGYPDGMSGFVLKITKPEGATVTPTVATPYATAIKNDAGATYDLTWAGSANTASEGNLIATFDIVYATAPTDEFDVEVADGSSVDDTDDATGATTTIEKPGDLPGAWVAIGATGEVETDADLADIVDPENATKDAETDEVYVALDVTKADGTPAEYDTDYTAYYNGTKLTKQQLDNYLTGTYGEVADAIRNISFKYNNGVTVAAQIVKNGEIADSGETTSGDKPAETTKYAASTVKLAKSGNQSIKTNSGKQTNTLTVTTGKDKDGNARDFGTLTFQLDKDSVEALTLAGVVITYTADADYGVATAATADTETVTVKVADDEPVVLGESTDGKYTITFTPGAKGTVKYTATYDGYNKKGEAETQTATVTYKITEPSTGGGSSSSSSSSDKNTSSGGGAIASGLVDSGSSYIPSLGFDDLGDVEWAQTAINTLAARKIVSGVGDNKFDPNAALTRAAYAQMLVNAIGHSQDSADVEFDDVPTDAWFYHNVAVAAQLGIVSGYGDGNFGPYDLITREQMALMTLKAAEVMGVSLVGADAGTFTDDADIADWSRDAVYTLSNAGIINGMGDGTFAPKANATRAQAAVIIYNTFIK